MSATGTEPNTQPPGPALRLNWTDWLPYLEEQDVPEAQKRELIETLWGIVVSFVDLGWQVKSERDANGAVLDLTAILTAVDVDRQEEAAE